MNKNHLKANQNYFALIKDFLETEVKPIANELDSNPVLFSELFVAFKKFDWFSLLIPKEFGGFGGNRQTLVEYNILLSQYLEALLFCQAQHQYVIMELLKYPITPTIGKFFQTINEQKTTYGISLAAKKNLLTIAVEKQGFRISGKFPWVSGFGLSDKFFISFIHNDKLYYTLIPFRNCQVNQGSINCGQPVQTIVMNAISTVQVEVNNWLVEESTINIHGSSPMVLDEAQLLRFRVFSLVGYIFLNNIPTTTFTYRPNIISARPKFTAP